MQWLQDLSEINGDNLNNTRRDESRHFRNKKREHLKEEIDRLYIRNIIRGRCSSGHN
jgi:hypothetical protein